MLLGNRHEGWTPYIQVIDELALKLITLTFNGRTKALEIILFSQPGDKMSEIKFEQGQPHFSWQRTQAEPFETLKTRYEGTVEKIYSSKADDADQLNYWPIVDKNVFLPFLRQQIENDKTIEPAVKKNMLVLVDANRPQEPQQIITNANQPKP